MIVRFGGGSSGIAEYLEKGSKYGRHYSRDELDNRIIIDGDLEVTDKIINDISDKGQERYLHITLSFNEPDITVEKMQAAYEDYKSLFLTAYKDDEINTYAEIHWPKTQQLLDKSTNEMYDRFPHIHMVIPKQNLLTGGYTNPQGFYTKNLNMWEALQEDVNNRHGLKSPAHSPRISLENYKAVLDRHKVSQFKSKDGDFKKSIFDTIEKQQVYSWQDFKDVVSSYGEIKVRNQGKDTEYYAVKLPDNDKFTNLNNPVFSKSYIEKREIPHKPLTQYQINNRLKQWEVVSKEIKYIDDASAAAKKAYRTLGDEQKVSFLQKHETHFYEEYDEKELPESNFRPFSFGSSDFEFGGGGQADRRSLHNLPSRLLVHSGTARGNLTRAELLLSDDEIRDLQFAEADSDAGLHGALQATERVITDKTQIKSLSSQIIFDIEEGAAIATSNDLQLFKEIRTNLKPELVLAYAQANHLINPEEHTFFRAKDGSARIAFGKYNYNVSDFFTKGLGLEWKETEVILKSLYEAQNSGLKVEPVSNNTLKECLIGFEEDIYSVKLEAFKRVSNTIDKDESLSIKQINARYFTENRRISKLEFTTWNERENLKSINAFEKLVAEENLKAIMFGNRQDANAIKYPFSDHFEKYLTQQKVIDMSLINDLKEKYAKPKETENELENSIGGKGFDFVLNGKEAARRAKLTANLARQGQPNTRYGYSFKELTPNQQKDSVVFSHGGKKLFETKANRTKVLGGLDFDKTATALVYSMQRYGNPLDINGTEKFREQIIEVAARNELKVEFTDPALNDALKVRLEELQLEAANENSISAEDLELDKSLGERAAVDKAMLESKHREIEADLQQPNQAAVDLAAIAITQRLNAHEHEPITAETAALDTAVYNELKQTPALQAYFAVEMSKIGAANAEYRAEFIKNEPEEFMLANHAARKFTDELETAYQANKPQEELDLTLDEAALQELEAKQSTINQLDATKDPAKLDLEAMYQNELIGRALANQEQEIAFGDRAMQAWENNKQQEQLLVDKIAERIDSGDIKVEDLGLDVLSTDDRNSIANAYMKTTTISALTADDLLKLTGEEFTPPKFDLEQLNKTLLELEPVIGENLIPWEESSWSNEAVNAPTMEQLAQELEDSTYSISSGFSQEIADLESGAKSTMTVEHSDPKGNHIYLQKTGNGWQVSLSNDGVDFSDVYEDEIIPPHYADFQADNLYDAVKNMVDRVREEQQNYEHSSEQKEIADEIQQAEATLHSFQAEIQYQKERLETFNTRLEELQQDISDLRNDPEMEGEKVYLQKEMEDINLAIEQASMQLETAENELANAQAAKGTDFNEPTFDDSGAAALSRLESIQIERLKGGHSHQETFVTDDMLISIQKTDDGWQVLSGENTGAMHEVLQTERLDDALDYYESNKTLGMQVEQATEKDQWDNTAKDAAGFTAAFYSARVAANNFEELPQEIEGNNKLINAYKSALQEQLDNGLPESDEATAKELVSKAELQIHNNVLALIPEEFTEVREQIQADFDQSLEKNSTVTFEDLLMANKEVLMRDLNIDIDPEESMESEAIFNSKTQDFIAQLESSEHLISYDESKTLSEQFAELKSGAASSLILEGNDNNQNYILIENAENGWQVTQGDAHFHFSADDFTEEDCPPEYIPFETSSFEEAVENMAQREGNLSMAEKLEQQQSEPEASVAESEKTLDTEKPEPILVGYTGYNAGTFEEQLEDVKSKRVFTGTPVSMRVFDDSEAFEKFNSQIESGERSHSNEILKGDKFINIEPVENGWQVRTGSPQWDAESIAEDKSAIAKYDVFHASSLDEAVKNFTERTEGFEERGNQINVKTDWAMILETFEKEPAPLSVENAGDKHTANQISELKAPESEQEAKEIAETLSAGLKELRGKPELRQAALAAVALVDSSPLLQGEMAEIAESDNFVEVVLETTRTYSDDLQMTQSAPDVDMDM